MSSASASSRPPNLSFPSTILNLSKDTPPIPSSKDAHRPRHQNKASLSSGILQSGVHIDNNKHHAHAKSHHDEDTSLQNPSPSTYTISFPIKHSVSHSEQTSSDKVNISCFDALLAYTSLLDGCMGVHVEQFADLTRVFLNALDHCFQELEGQLTHDAMASSAYLHFKSEYSFNRHLLETSGSRLTLTPEEQTHQVYEGSKVLWDSFSRLLRAAQQGELDSKPNLEALKAHMATPLVNPHRLSQCYVDANVSKEVEDVSVILKTSFMSSSAASIKTAKHSVAEYFSKFSLKLRMPRHFRSISTASKTDAHSVVSRHKASSSTDSSTLPSSSQSQTLSTTANHTPHTYGLRESHIFFTAASSFVASLPTSSRFDKPGPTFNWNWYVPLPEKAIWTEIVLADQEGNGLLKKKVLAAGSFPMLVRYVLENIDDLDCGDFIDGFFMFFRKHSSSEALFNLLAIWYSGESHGAKTYMQAQPATFRRFAKVQIIKLLSRWLELYWLEAQDEVVRQPLQDFTFNVVANDKDLHYDLAGLLSVSLCRTAKSRVTRHTKTFQRQIDQAEKDQQKHPQTSFRPQLVHMTSLVARGDNIKLIGIMMFSLNGGIEELARALTLLESDHFHDIIPESIVDWRGDKFEKLRRWDSFVNTLTFFVVDCVLNHKNEADRATVYEMMVDIAVSCKSMRNFSSAKTIALSLNLTAITRLLGTMAGVSKDHKERHAQLVKFFENKEGYNVEISQTRPAVPLPETLKYAVTRCDLEARKYVKHDEVKKHGYMDMMFYERIARVVRGLENIYGQYSIPRQIVVLQWIEAIRRPYEHYSYADNEEKMFSKSCKLVPQRPEEKRKPKN
ncbi:hypothetical protein EUX98_g5968 [Antrodiella citrinella]|uniref:Ras-GEF domain-containing protein n=1 Tax=Antrodiella citrinella TaxID=2447956 RepID=A0A4S4MXT8_9APHY|nr:hypothetical protein EUX98_g5968 [Antrodiella citrinella]